MPSTAMQKFFGNLMLSPILQRNGLTHIRTASMERKTRISLAIRDMTDPLVLFSARMEQMIMGRRFVEGRAEHPQE